MQFTRIFGNDTDVNSLQTSALAGFTYLDGTVYNSYAESHGGGGGGGGFGGGGAGSYGGNGAAGMCLCQSLCAATELRIE